MAQQPQRVVMLVDVRRATNAGSDNSRNLTINKVVFPEVKHKTTNFAPGGGVGEVQWNLPQIEALSPKFEIKGIDSDVLSTFGFSDGVNDKWVFSAAVKDQRTSKVMPLRATIQGVMSTWTPDDHSQGDYHGCNFEMTQVVYYEYVLDNEVLYFYDYYNSVVKSGGVDAMAELRQAAGF